jgi:hypothetical protein
MILRIVTIAALLLLAACGERTAAAPRIREAVRDSAVLWPERGEVMADSLMPHLLIQCSRRAPDPRSVQGYWRPAPDQIAELERGLAPLLRDSLGDGPQNAFLSRHLFAYHRQYAGLVLNGRKIIYVNAYTQAAPPADVDTLPWRETVTVICDGGKGVFGVEYDPATRRFRNLAFNGYA